MFTHTEGDVGAFTMNVYNIYKNDINIMQTSINISRVTVTYRQARFYDPLCTKSWLNVQHDTHRFCASCLLQQTSQ